MRTYSQMRALQTYEERFEYLKLRGSVGRDTFGYERWVNQRFYKSREWAITRDHVIARDLGRDLGVEGYEIPGRIFVHHINPMTPTDLHYAESSVLDPEFLISVSFDTHQAIHYGTEPVRFPEIIPRSPGDTTLW